MAPHGSAISAGIVRQDASALQLDRASLLASALDAIVSIDADGRIVEFNPSAERTFGWRAEDVMGLVLTEVIVPPAHRAAHDAGLARVAAGGGFTMLGKRVDVTALRSDGAEFPAELTITHTSDDPFVVTAFVRDVTERRETEEALRESQERFSRAFTEAPVGIALVDLEPATSGRLLEVNRSLCEMLRTTEAVLLEADFAALIHPDELETSGRELAAVLRGDKAAYVVENRYRRGDGTTMWALLYGSVARGPDGTPLYGICQIQDITERKAAEEALRSSEAQLARTQRLAGIGAWGWDMREDVFTWSEGLNAVFGPPPPGVKVTTEIYLSVLHPDDRARVGELVTSAATGNMPGTWEYRARGIDGELHHMFAWGEIVRGDDGRPLAMSGYAQDVTNLRRAQEEAEELRHATEQILSAAGEGIVRLDTAGLTTYVNPAAGRILGREPRASSAGPSTTSCTTRG
jgi:PAS domain S-box-containing protein